MCSSAARPNVEFAVDPSCCHATLVGLKSHCSDKVLQNTSKPTQGLVFSIAAGPRAAN